MPESTPIKVAFLWHMHQPNYREPNQPRLAMPWVRLHALKDYLDMPLTAASVDNVHVTFNLVPSLLDQIKLYLDGGTDRHLELTEIPADQLNLQLRQEILESFFSGNLSTMIEPHLRYKELYAKFKAGDGFSDTVPMLFSSGEMRDLQVWSNLVWVDPHFHKEEPIKTLVKKERHFTEADKVALVDWQRRHLARIVSTYRQLQDDGKIEVSFTPYYHPILPLLCDTDVAREALPRSALPEHRFRHPEDARHQIHSAAIMYRELFGRSLNGMWPSEGSVSEEALDIIADEGIQWAASDQEVLVHSFAKSGWSTDRYPIHSVFEYKQSGLKLLFRDHGLSDKIGFVYSTWDAEKAVMDFVQQLKSLRSLLRNHLDRTVVPVILDGENAWEYFPDDGNEFLNLLYSELGRDPEIDLVTVSDAIKTPPVAQLPKMFAGSWINHNFRIWIGHSEDNAAWDLLKSARDTLVSFHESRPDFDPERIKQAWEQIYIAEGSDWCWWYGDEHRGAHNEQFDSIFRKHLSAVYELLELPIPSSLLHSLLSAEGRVYASPPENLLTPKIDGRVTHYYEWSGAGSLEDLANGAMHRVNRKFSGLKFGYDHENFYIRLDFGAKNALDSLHNAEVRLVCFSPEEKSWSFALSQADGEIQRRDEYFWAADEVLELAVHRMALWPNGYGRLEFALVLSQNGRELERWPDSDLIALEIPEKGQEIFWPS